MNQEVAVVSVVLYQALRPDTSLAALSASAPRTWLSTLRDFLDNMHHIQRMAALVQSQQKRERERQRERIVFITDNVASNSDVCHHRF